MFYRLSDGHGLPFNPIKSLVAPRPIAWVGTRGAVDNLAPYSFFALHALDLVSITISPQPKSHPRPIKDTLGNIRSASEFSIALAQATDLDLVVKTAADAPPDIDEFAHFGVAKAECHAINAPRVAQAPAALECRLEQELQIDRAVILFGRIVAVHIDDRYLRDGRFDNAQAQLLARFGYYDYLIGGEMTAALTPPWPATNR